MGDTARHFPYVTVSATTHGLGPLIYHVRDAEKVIDALPSFAIPITRIHPEMVIGLRWFSGVIALPSEGIAQSVPDDTCADWEWSDGSSLLLLVGALPDSGLPGLDRLPTWPLGTMSIRVNGRPMALSLHVQQRDGWWRAEIHGYLDDRCPFQANIIGQAQAVRDQLVAAVMSLTVQRVEESARGA